MYMTDIYIQYTSIGLHTNTNAIITLNVKHALVLAGPCFYKSITIQSQFLWRIKTKQNPKLFRTNIYLLPYVSRALRMAFERSGAI